MWFNSLEYKQCIWLESASKVPMHMARPRGYIPYLGYIDTVTERSIAQGHIVGMEIEMIILNCLAEAPGRLQCADRSLQGSKSYLTPSNTMTRLP